ncbi:MAG: AbrB/MazE/SpoVT family DNA-binding domain-containing protein [Candidatus Humimicrobiaceae bacterium]
MSRITQKGQVTIPKKIRDLFGIKPNDFGEFIVKDGYNMFLVKKGNILNSRRKGTILDAHRIKTDKKIDFAKLRELMEKDIATNITRDSI